MSAPSRSLSDLRRKRGQELAALIRIRRRGMVLLEISGTRAEMWAILKELDDALERLQDANWIYFDRITGDEFQRERAERYEQEASDKGTEMQAGPDPCQITERAESGSRPRSRSGGRTCCKIRVQFRNILRISKIRFQRFSPAKTN